MNRYNLSALVDQAPELRIHVNMFAQCGPHFLDVVDKPIFLEIENHQLWLVAEPDTRIQIDTFRSQFLANTLERIQDKFTPQPDELPVCLLISELLMVV